MIYYIFKESKEEEESGIKKVNFLAKLERPTFPAQPYT